MRADRLVATVLLMQSRGRVTAAELADELEVSVATARRDLEALAAAGVPVYPQPGRGGGWQLVGGARTDLSGLSAGETEALFLLLGPAATTRPEARSAVHKLVQALPTTFRDDARSAAQAVLVDPVRWGGAAPAAHALLERIQTAVVRRWVLRFDYPRRTGASVVREVEPLALVDKDGTWYLIGGTASGRRTFRVDRIAALEQTEQGFARPDGLDLDTEWRTTIEAMEQRRSSVWATVRAPRRLLPVLQHHFGRHCEVIEPADASAPHADDRVTLRIGAHTITGLSEQLAGWTDLDVLDPPEVRSELAQIGAGLVARYGGQPGWLGTRPSATARSSTSASSGSCPDR